MQRVELTPQRLAVILAGLAVLTALTVHRLWFAGPPGGAADTLEIRGQTMGTTYLAKVVQTHPPVNPEEAATAVHAALDDVNRKMSTYDPKSELSRFNAHAATDPFPLSPDTIAVLEIARTVSEQSAGAFDVTVGPLVNRWGFGPELHTSPPSNDEIAALRDRVGYEKIIVNSQEGTASKSQPGVYCDLSAIAKGYGVDRAAAALDALGFTNYLVEVGGETRARGRSASGAPWTVGIERPEDTAARAAQRIISLTDISIATSGDYRNYFERDGKRYSHEINPRTGRPIEHRLASVSVLHPECAWADAYATALLVLGPDEGPKLAEALALPAYFITRTDTGFDERTAAGFERFFRE